MKRIIGCMALSFLYYKALSQSKIVADISNVKNDKGVCRACLFINEASFSGEKGEPFQCLFVPVKNKTSQIVFCNVPSGIYALFVFHDANNNNKMDRNFIGIPKESYGASRNKLPFASAPSFTDNWFTIEDRKTITLHIRLRNL